MSMPIVGGGSGVNAQEVIKAAQTLHTTANTQLKNEQTVEQNDMLKATSIFTQANEIIDKSTTRGNNVVLDTTDKIGAKQKDAQDLGDKKVNPTKQLIQEYTTKLEELNKKKKEIEQKLKEAGEQVQESNGENPPQAPIEESEAKPAKGSKTGKGTKAKSAKRSSGSKRGGEIKAAPKIGGDVQALKTQLDAVNGEIKSTSDSLNTESKNMEEYNKTLDGYNDDIDTLASDGENALDGVQDDMQNKMDTKRDALNPILESQSKSLGSNTAMSEKAEGFADNEIKAALQDKYISNSDKRDLKRLSKDLKLDSKKLGKETGLAGKNEKNINDTIPGYKKDMIDAEMSAINNDFKSMNNSINQAYSNALATISKIQNNAADVSASGTSAKGDKDTKLASEITSKASNLAKGALDGADMGDMLKDTLVSTGMEMAKGALDKLFPGLGSGLDMLGSIFGGFF